MRASSCSASTHRCSAIPPLDLTIELKVREIASLRCSSPRQTDPSIDLKPAKEPQHQFFPVGGPRRAAVLNAAQKPEPHVNNRSPVTQRQLQQPQLRDHSSSK